MFRAIASDNFAPFGKLRLELPPVPNKPENLGEVHLFTGINGTGKTRLLSLLGAMLGHPVPLQNRLKGTPSPTVFAVTDQHPPDWQYMEAAVGPHHVASDSWSRFQADSTSVDWIIEGAGAIPSSAAHVPGFAYRALAYVNDAEIKTMIGVRAPTRAECLSFDRPDSWSHPLLLQAIANLKIQAAVDSMNATSPTQSSRAVKLTTALESALSGITGVNFRFTVQHNPTVALCVTWGGETLFFNVLPDGLRSIIGWMVHALVTMDLWLQGKGDPRETEAVFLVDEIESHLHPAWQRRVLPAFQLLFPKAQIFVATHSPFVIASLNHGWIHSLKMGSDGIVTAEKPIAASQGESYISVVEDIMGVKEWYDVETEKMLSEFRSARDNAYKGNAQAQEAARKLARQIGERSQELDFMMGKELIQMDRQLAKSAGGR